MLNRLMPSVHIVSFNEKVQQGHRSLHLQWLSVMAIETLHLQWQLSCVGAFDLAECFWSNVIFAVVITRTCTLELDSIINRRSVSNNRECELESGQNVANVDKWPQI